MSPEQIEHEERTALLRNAALECLHRELKQAKAPLAQKQMEVGMGVVFIFTLLTVMFNVALSANAFIVLLVVLAIVTVALIINGITMMSLEKVALQHMQQIAEEFYTTHRQDGSPKDQPTWEELQDYVAKAMKELENKNND